MLATEVPLWLAERQRELAVGDELAGPADVRSLFERLAWADVVEGAGFAPATGDRLRRIESLPDLVGPGMRLLVVGLNPSPASAEHGIPFARRGNRFWPAALDAGLVDRDRDPLHAIAEHGIGFTDLVKRTTRRAADVDRSEFVDGLARLDRLCRWLEPGACVMVGLMGWRAAVDAKATTGWHDHTLGGRGVYVMPSTSGLNAATPLSELTEHLGRAAAGPE